MMKAQFGCSNIRMFTTIIRWYKIKWKDTFYITTFYWKLLVLTPFHFLDWDDIKTTRTHQNMYKNTCRKDVARTVSIESLNLIGNMTVTLSACKQPVHCIIWSEYDIGSSLIDTNITDNVPFSMARRENLYEDDRPTAWINPVIVKQKGCEIKIILIHLD